jgi:hypothetical protein
LPPAETAIIAFFLYSEHFSSRFVRIIPIATPGTYGDFRNMSFFIRNFISIVLVIGLSVMVGCSSTGGNKTAAKPSPFPWVKQQEPEKAGSGSMNEFIGRDRPSVAGNPTRLGNKK